MTQLSSMSSRDSIVRETKRFFQNIFNLINQVTISNVLSKTLSFRFNKGSIVKQFPFIVNQRIYNCLSILHKYAVLEIPILFHT